MTLGERIRQCRIDAHLSQEKVAELIGVSRQAVTKWETNQSTPSTDNLFRLAELLGTTVDFLASPEPTEENTLAAQIHLLYKAEEEKRAKQQRANRKYNILTFAAVLGGYLAVFLAGRILSGGIVDMTLLAWLFDTAPQRSTYLFGWLLSSNLFLCASIVSSLPALFGKRRYALISTLGFMVGLPLGEFCGRNPYCSWEHWGWAIWLLIYLAFCVYGGILQHIWKSKPDFRSKRFCILSATLFLSVILIILSFRLNMRPCP